MVGVLTTLVVWEEGCYGGGKTSTWLRGLCCCTWQQVSPGWLHAHRVQPLSALSRCRLRVKVSEHSHQLLRMCDSIRQVSRSWTKLLVAPKLQTGLCTVLTTQVLTCVCVFVCAYICMYIWSLCICRSHDWKRLELEVFFDYMGTLNNWIYVLVLFQLLFKVLKNIGFVKWVRSFQPQVLGIQVEKENNTYICMNTLKFHLLYLLNMYILLIYAFYTIVGQIIVNHMRCLKYLHYFESRAWLYAFDK